MHFRHLIVRLFAILNFTAGLSVFWNYGVLSERSFLIAWPLLTAGAVLAGLDFLCDAAFRIGSRPTHQPPDSP